MFLGSPLKERLAWVAAAARRACGGGFEVLSTTDHDVVQETISVDPPEIVCWAAIESTVRCAPKAMMADQ